MCLHLPVICVKQPQQSKPWAMMPDFLFYIRLPLHLCVKSLIFMFFYNIFHFFQIHGG